MVTYLKKSSKWIFFDKKVFEEHLLPIHERNEFLVIWGESPKTILIV